MALARPSCAPLVVGNLGTTAEATAYRDSCRAGVVNTSHLYPLGSQSVQVDLVCGFVCPGCDRGVGRRREQSLLWQRASFGKYCVRVSVAWPVAVTHVSWRL